jgi:endonuclease YncB( thermonuclease family)
MLDIDAPELSEGGLEAREWLKSRLLYREVLVLVDSSNRVGKYGRLLGRILSGGLIVGEEMLHLGLVSEFGQKNEGSVRDSGYYLEADA